MTDDQQARFVHEMRMLTPDDELRRDAYCEELVGNLDDHDGGQAGLGRPSAARSVHHDLGSAEHAELPMAEQLRREKIAEGRPGRYHTPQDVVQVIAAVFNARDGDTIVCEDRQAMVGASLAHHELCLMQADAKVLHLVYPPGYGDDEPDPFIGIAPDDAS